MTSHVLPTAIPSPHRSGGWSAIASGAIGIIAFACMVTAVRTRTSMSLSPSVAFFFRAHDVGLMIQLLLMIPVAAALQKLSDQRIDGFSRATRNVGIGILCLNVLILLLIFPKFLPDVYYIMFQGAFGGWLMVVCWQMRRILSGGMRWFGLVVGFALALLGPIPLGLAVVYPGSLDIPAVDPGSFAYNNSRLNEVLHALIPIGTFIGVLPLPFWSFFIGRRLLRVQAEDVRS